MIRKAKRCRVHQLRPNRRVAEVDEGFEQCETKYDAIRQRVGLMHLPNEPSSR